MKQIDLDIHKYPASIRFKFLDLLGIKQKTTGIPKFGVNIVEHFKDLDVAGLKKRTEQLSKLIGSEGNVVSSADSTYVLTSGARKYSSLKFHNSSTLTAKCISSKETKTKGIFNLHWGILAGEKYNRFNKDNIIKQGKETFINGGTTFSTKFNPTGKNILLEFENFNLINNSDKNYFEFSAWSPRFLAVTKDKVDTVDSVVGRAIKDRVFQAKTISNSKISYHKGENFDVYKFAEDDKDKPDPKFKMIVEEISKLKTEASEYSRDDKEKENYKILKQKLSELEEQLLEYLKKKELSSYTVGNITISIRKIPTFYSITSERLAINSLKKAGLERFLIDNPLIDIPALKAFLNKEENKNLKLEGISKNANVETIYIYRNFSDNDILIDEVEFESFYEMEGYDPKDLDDKVLGDDWRLVCAHFSTIMHIGENNFKFSLNQVLDVAFKIITEIKKRVRNNKMNYNFNLVKMKPLSKSLYMNIRDRLPLKLQNVGEVHNG